MSEFETRNIIAEVSRRDLIGRIVGFPLEIVKWMINCQVEAGNKPCVEVFQRNSCANHREGGFDWQQTKEGGFFCAEVIGRRHFDAFFRKYPRSSGVESILGEYRKSAVAMEFQKMVEASRISPYFGGHSGRIFASMDLASSDETIRIPKIIKNIKKMNTNY